MCDYMCMNLLCLNSASKKPSGLMVDGKKFARLVSFDPSLRATFDTAKHEKMPVNINNCIVKHGRDAGQLEILATSKSRCHPENWHASYS